VSAEKLLTVTASNQTFALPVQDVVEIIRVGAISRVPHAPDSLLGIANFRNTALPVVSLARLLGSPTSPQDDRTRIVVVAIDNPAGLLVDSIGLISDAGDHQVLDARALLQRDFSSKRHKPLALHKSALTTTSTDQINGNNAAEQVAFVSFMVAGQDYALPLSHVVAITDFPDEITEVPRADDAIVGMAEIKSELVPLVSLRALLGLSNDGFDTASAHVTLVRLAGKTVGLIADSMKAILRISPNSLDAVPSVLTRGTGEASIQAICRLDGGRLVSILAVERLFDAETTQRLMAASPSRDAPMESPDAEDSQEQFLIFQLGRERYGLPIALVDEIVRRPDHLTRVPRAPPFVDGIMNLRGKMIPVVDQRLRFSMESSTDRRTSRIIVLTIDGLQTGIVVDRVSEILSIAPSELKPAPEMKAAAAVVDRVAIGNSDGDMILMINAQAFLDRAERDMLAALRDDQDQRE
jgi:purine-binding chemotaxis protein CheW